MLTFAQLVQAFGITMAILLVLCFLLLVRNLRNLPPEPRINIPDMRNLKNTDQIRNITPSRD